MDASKYLLRVGVTPDCNFKCIYCNPVGNRDPSGIMKDQEIIDLIQIASATGIKRVHITGGEPLLRKNIIKILREGNTDGKLKYYLTTNGSLLKKYAKDLKEVGFDRINVSIDSINETSYKKVTGANKLNSALQGLEEAKKYFDLIKLNFLVLRQYNIDEIGQMVAYAQENKFILRLSELLPFSSARQQPKFFQNNFVSKKEILEILKDKFGELKQVDIEGNNWACDYFVNKKIKTPVAIVYHHTRGYQCVEDRCTSIRVSPSGHLAACYTLGYPTQTIKGLSFDEKKAEFDKCLKIKNHLKEEGYPLYHIPDYTLFRANVGESWRK